MSKLRNLSDQRFGRLTVLGRDNTVYQHKKQSTRWWCKCDCGKIISVISYDLTRGHTNSCGCYHKQQARNSLTAIRARNSNYGKSKTKSYRCWKAMMSRCYNHKMIFYDYYGGRGIDVCERWHVYDNFLHDMGEPSESQTLDRIDCNKGYSLENCRWITMKEQAGNRRSSLRISYNGETLCLSHFAEKYGLSYYHVRAFFNHHVPPEKMIEILHNKTKI